MLDLEDLSLKKFSQQVVINKLGCPAQSNSAVFEIADCGVHELTAIFSNARTICDRIAGCASQNCIYRKWLQVNGVISVGAARKPARSNDKPGGKSRAS